MSAQLTTLAGTAPAQAPSATASDAADTGPAASGTLAEVIELYPGSSTGPGSSPATARRRKNRLAILRLKLAYFGRARLMASDAGMATAEYAIATLAAVGFAGLLVFVLRSEEVRGFLLNLIRTALALP